MIFINDLEKTYNKVPREIICRIIEKRRVSVSYIKLIKHIYEDVTTKMKTLDELTKAFPIKIGLHQISALSSFSFYINHKRTH